MQRRRFGFLITLIALWVAASVHAADGYSADVDRHVMAGGVLEFERPPDFGLAANRHQLPAVSYIPPCESGFDYCLYYIDDAYEGTNFESAGLRISRREDLDHLTACLLTPPDGYVEMEPRLHHGDGFVVSLFDPVQDAAMGHYATGSLYRLAIGAECYEFETRIGQSRYEFYEPGAIGEFTEEDFRAMEARLLDLLDSVRLVERPEISLFRGCARHNGIDSGDVDRRGHRWDC